MSNNNNSKTVNKLDYVGINLVEMISHSNKGSTSTPITDCITEVNQTPYDVDESDDEALRYLLGCAKRGYNRGKQLPPSICEVPKSLREHNESFFTPEWVSIGPIHREDPKLKEFEGLKECYLDDLLHRCNSTPKETLEACLQKVNDLMPEIRESYPGVKKKKNYSDVELATMMVMDGCFILEFCFKHQKINLYLPDKMQTNRIAMDLILLENQIPFFVLQALFDCSMGKESSTLSQVLDTYLAPYIKLFWSPEKISTTDVYSYSTPAHVLGYLHKRYQLVAAKSSNPIYAEASKLVDEELPAKSWNLVHAEASKLVDEEPIENTAFHSIVELDRSGMNFKPHQEDVWSMTIKFQSSPFPCLPLFWGKPTLLMPTLVIDDTTELILRNFIAYEQLFPKDRYLFTSYAVAMDKLIDGKEDIAKLVESKVLVNNLSSNQEAADMINKICKNISIIDFYYTQEFKQMDKFYNAFWTKTLAPFRRVILDDTRTASEIILLYLGMVQTYYTIRGSA